MTTSNKEFVLPCGTSNIGKFSKVLLVNQKVCLGLLKSYQLNMTSSLFVILSEGTSVVDFIAALSQRNLTYRENKNLCRNKCGLSMIPFVVVSQVLDILLCYASSILFSLCFWVLGVSFVISPNSEIFLQSCLVYSKATKGIFYLLQCFWPLTFIFYSLL